MQSNEIEQVLRRYEFRAIQAYSDISLNVQYATNVLEDVGYHVSAMPAAGADVIQPTVYFVEIGGRTIHAGISPQTLIGFAHDLCNDYRERDMAALVEYVKNHRDVQIETIMDGVANGLRKTAVAGARAGKAFRDALVSLSNLDDGLGVEAAWPVNEEKESTLMCDCGERKSKLVSSVTVKVDMSDIQRQLDELRESFSCITAETLMKHYNFLEQQQHGKHGDCGERLESLSERVERLERAGKCKDDECIISGTRHVEISPDNGFVVDTNAGNRVWVSGHTYNVPLSVGSGIGLNTSDNVTWNTAAGTGVELIDKAKIVAEIERRAEMWRIHSTAAEIDGKVQKARRYDANARVLQCLADDIASGALDNE